MTSPIGPEELRETRFRTVLRGLDRSHVEETLEAAAARLEALEREVEELRNQSEDGSGPDLDAELEAVGAEVAEILKTARDAANAMRDRASADSSRWRSEASAEADQLRRSAAADSEAMRRDAWVTGTELLEQAQTMARAMLDQAERDVLTIQGEAEREAHRLTSGARREAEEVVRNATMDAEKMIADATRRRDDIIAQANRQSAAAQERTRALEERRDELLEELEAVRGTLTRLEGSLEERRDRLDLSRAEPTSVKVVHPEPAPPPAEDWSVGETVRVIPAEEGPRFTPTPPEQVFDRIEEETEAESTEETTDIAQPEPAEDAPPSPEPTEDEVESLFASLRESGSEEEKPVPEQVEEAETEPGTPGRDWLDERDSRLLPIVNRALRGVKKSMTEMQNIVLDAMRTDSSWRPEPGDIGEQVRADLIALWSESFAAGHDVAELMTEEKLPRPRTAQSQAPEEFGRTVAQALESALSASADSPWEQQAAVSKVFRLWRSDEAERWLREKALEAYERGLEDSLTVPAAPDGG